MPETKTLMLFLMVTSEYEFLMSAHDVAMKMRRSRKKTEEDVNALASFVLVFKQYIVMSMLLPVVPIGASI